MPFPSRRAGVARLALAGALSVACGALVLAQQKKGDQKPDQPAAAAQQAQTQEIETAYRAADTAMSTGQPVVRPDLVSPDGATYA